MGLAWIPVSVDECGMAAVSLEGDAALWCVFFVVEKEEEEEEEGSTRMPN